MRQKMYDKHGKKYYIRHVSPDYVPIHFMEAVKSWFFDHIGGRIHAISPDDNGGLVQWPITPFISAKKFKQIKQEAEALYPNEDFSIAMNMVLKSRGLIIR